MGIWLELIVLALCAYAMGVGLGWLLWHRTPDADEVTRDNKE